MAHDLGREKNGPSNFVNSSFPNLLEIQHVQLVGDIREF